MAISNEAKVRLNNASSIARKAGVGTIIDSHDTKINLAVKTVQITYDFAVNGGALSTINLAGTLPAKAIVTQVVLDVTTAVTSGGAATVTLKAGSTALTGALAIASLVVATGTTPLASSATAIKLAAATSTFAVTIATATVTAGKFYAYVSYIEGI